ncbi:MAG: type VI secretion system tip protein TssI/VgrG [Polyangiales bacterium]
MNVLGSLAYKFTLEGAEVVWELVEVVIDEALHELPRYTFDVITAAPLEAKLLTGAFDFEMVRMNNLAPEGDPEVRKGYIVGVDLMHRTDVSRYRQRVRVSHKGWLLTLNRRRRIFMGPIKASDVINTVLSEHGLRASVDASKRTREVITQFDESDYDFIRRLCEDDGLTLLFAHDDATAVRVKDVSAGTSLPSIGTSTFAPPQMALTLGEPCVQHFSRELRVTAGKVRAAEWDIKKADTLKGTGQLPPDFGAPTKGIAAFTELHVAAGGHLPAMSDVTNAANYFFQSRAQVADLHRGTGNQIKFRAGSVVELEDPSEGVVTGKFLLTRVVHRMTLSDDPGGSGGTDMVYENDFECVLATRPHRPAPVVPRPLVTTPQMAVVKKFPKTEAGNGWVEVQVSFPWHGDTQHATTWARVSQTLAGNGFGSQFIPREGMEVVVHFIDGDPDRPLITGVVYNGKNAPPVPLPADHSRSTIRTRSFGGNSPDNEVFFEDKDGAEVLGLIATRDHTVEVTHDAKIHVKNDRAESVDNNDAHTVKGTLTTTVHKDRTTTLKANDKKTVQQNLDLTVQGNAKGTIYQQLTLSADVGIVLQCGDTKIELTPTGVLITNGGGAKVELTPAAVTVAHPTSGSMELADGGATVKNLGGAQVALVGPMVNLN